MARSCAVLLVIAALATSGRSQADVAPHELPAPRSEPTGRRDGIIGFGAEVLYATWIGSASFGELPTPSSPPASAPASSMPSEASAPTPWGRRIGDWYRPGPMLGVTVVTGQREGYAGFAVRSSAWTPMSSVKDPSHLEFALTVRGIVGETVGFAYGLDLAYFTVHQDIAGGEFHFEGMFLGATAGPCFTPRWARWMTFEPYATLGLAALSNATFNDVDAIGGDNAAGQVRAGMRLTLTL